ncbi:hypothetical protein B0H11DRAFT_2274541 [Mycena galericulata]|nr:hypothetical protein B0H11DRAFT_2274541 [Mycena galericulata]
MSAEINTMKFTGPLFIGAILTWALLGSLTIQTCQRDDYHNTSRCSDRTWIQFLVYGVFLVELLQTALITHTCWVTLISNWGILQGLIDTPWSSAATVIFNGFVSATVQCFFAWRIWRLSVSNVGRAAAVLISAIALMQLAAAAAVTVEYALLNRDYRRFPSVYRAVDIWLAGTLVCDTIIAVSMVTILARAQQESCFKSTETVLNRLIINTIETGAITAGIALLELILFNLFPTFYYHNVCATGLTQELSLKQAHRYSNVLVASLNGRHRSRNVLRNAVNTLGKINGENGIEMSVFTSTQNSMIEQGVVISTTVDTDAAALDTYTQGNIAAV